jgi:hypothetical protein
LAETNPGNGLLMRVSIQKIISDIPRDENKDQQGKGNVHSTQPLTHQSHHSRAPRSHQTKSGTGHKGGVDEGQVMCEKVIKIKTVPYGN